MTTAAHRMAHTLHRRARTAHTRRRAGVPACPRVCVPVGRWRGGGVMGVGACGGGGFGVATPGGAGMRTTAEIAGISACVRTSTAAEMAGVSPTEQVPSVRGCSSAKGLRKRSTPMCTLSQNGYGAYRARTMCVCVYVTCYMVFPYAHIHVTNYL